MEVEHDLWEPYEESLWANLSFPSLKHLIVGHLDYRASIWLARNMKGSPHISQVTVSVRPYCRRGFLERLQKYESIKRIRILEEEERHHVQRFPPHSLHRWLATMPWLDAFEWRLPHYPSPPSYDDVPKLDTLIQLIFGLPGLQELALPLDGSNMLSQLETWHKLTQTAKDSIIGDSTSLVSLELYVMCIEPSDVEPTVKTLMEILPHQVALRVFVRPIMLKEKVPRGRQEIESLDGNVVMEAEFKRLIELYREKEGGGKE